MFSGVISRRLSASLSVVMLRLLVSRTARDGLEIVGGSSVSCFCETTGVSILSPVRGTTMASCCPRLVDAKTRLDAFFLHDFFLSIRFVQSYTRKKMVQVKRN